jgi:PST family polysaccharide transporter
MASDASGRERRERNPAKTETSETGSVARQARACTAAKHDLEPGLATRSERHRMISFAAWQTGSFVISGLLRLVAVGLVGRALQPETFGRLQYATSLYFYFCAVAEFGLVALGTRWIAQSPELAANHVRDISRSRLLMATAAYLLLAALAPWAGGSEQLFLVLYGVGLFLQAATLDWALRGLGRVDSVALVEVVRSAVYLASVGGLVSTPEHAVRVIVLQLGTQAAAAAALALLLRPRLRPAAPTQEKVLSSLRAAAPIAAGDIVASAYGQCDLVTLRWLGGVGEVGLYAPGLRMIQPFIQLVSVALLAWLPLLSVSAARSREGFARLMEDLLTTLAWLLVASALIGWIAGPVLLDALFGTGYAAGGTSFRLLIVSLGILAWRAPMSIAFIASGREWVYLAVISGSTLVKVIACAVLVRWGGAAGAAAGTVLAEICFAIGSALFLSSASPARLLRTCALPLLAGASAAVVYRLLLDLGTALAAGAAALLYACAGAVLLRGRVRRIEAARSSESKAQALTRSRSDRPTDA